MAPFMIRINLVDTPYENVYNQLNSFLYFVTGIAYSTNSTKLGSKKHHAFTFGAIPIKVIQDLEKEKIFESVASTHDNYIQIRTYYDDRKEIGVVECCIWKETLNRELHLPSYSRIKEVPDAPWA